MSAALDSSLEALALNYLGYGLTTAVNNIWAWIAVITAAVSFWRIRALSSSSRVAEISPEPSTSATRVSLPPAAKPSDSHRALEREGSMKVKFSMHYEEDSKDGGESEVIGGGAVMSRELDDWEKMMVMMRMGDMGWYRWQDRMVLDGSVVRLWEGRRRKHAAGGGTAW